MSTKRVLIATDVDRTILTQKDGEKYDFSSGVGHELIRLVKKGFNVAFITGNSMKQLTDRLLKFLVEELFHRNQLDLIKSFHFFCNAGGVYFHFGDQSDKVNNLIEKTNQQKLTTKDIMDSLIDNASSSVCSEFIDANYLKKTRIPKDEVRAIRKILEEQCEAYYSEIESKRSKIEKDYDLTHPTEIADRNDSHLIKPSVEERPIHYMDNGMPQMDTVQLTLKPILSYQHGKDKKKQVELFKKIDYRNSLVKKIQHQLDREGLVHYVARPGGRSSIDITYAKLDKAYALEFIIDHLNLQGLERLGQRFGSNTVYFGDEVIVGGGNDYPVTRIPGLLTFAVNRNAETVPLRSHVFVPSPTTQEVDATEISLRKLNDIARKQNSKKNNNRSVLDDFKEEIFRERIVEKLNSKTNLEAHNWQTLNALVSLMCRKDESAKKWVEILVNELDSIMIQLGDRAHQSAYGTSHPDA